MNLADDLNIFFTDFGTPAVITQPELPDKPVTVLFDLNSMDQAGILTDKPQISIPDSDLAGLDLRLATITVTGKFPAARMTKPLPDGSGLTTLLLTRQ